MSSKLLTLIVLITISCNLSINTYKSGKSNYEFHCASCHGNSAEGMGEWFPGLQDLEIIKSNRNELAAWIRHGISRDSTAMFKSRYNLSEMPANPSISETEICNILNYLNDEYWKLKPFTLQEINLCLKQYNPI